jgi:hypothetical protein
MGKIGCAIACGAAAITLAGAGYAHEVVGLTDALGHGVELGRAPPVGA